MSLSPGTRLGPYQIQSPLGTGGMGEVYKARDTRLDRTVAIKVLPEHVASDPELRQRFEREAKTLAALSHPHICPVYDVGTQDGIDFLVMEYLEGDTLAQRLSKGALPLDQALQVAIQIADALDKAHRKGIVHRDCKPGNIMLTGSGAARQGSPQAKLLDFGLAKLRPVGAPGAVALSAAPTVSGPLTGAGAILGTFQYMAPEQLEGEEADARTDIFAFGAVVYEMVTGKKAFEGKSQASLIHAIIGTEPRPVSDSQPVAPRSLDHLVRRCLAKDPDDRWQTARDVHQELRWVTEQPSAEPDPAPAVAPLSTHARRNIAAAAVASLVVGAALTAMVLQLESGAPAPAPVTRLQAPLAPAAPLRNPSLPQIAISPDGSAVAFIGRLPDGKIAVFLRPLGAEQATVVAGTEADAAFGPVFSSDGAWIAYRSLQELLKVPVGGGRPTSLARLDSVFLGQGLSWSRDDWIYYAANIGRAASAALFRVRASGGQPERLTTTTGIVAWPQTVGDGRFVIFTEVELGSGSLDSARIMVLDTQTRDTRALLDSGGTVPTVTASGHLLFVRGGSVFAVPFDEGRLEVTGTPREVLGGVQYEPAFGTAQYAVARNGTLVYLGGASPGTSLMWADGRGALQAFPTEQVYFDPRLSPDGRAVAVEVLGAGDDIWVLDLTRGTQTKLSLGGTEDETPAWSPDGLWVAWSTNRDDQRVILRKRADGSGAEEVLWSGPDHVHVSMYAADGRSLLFEQQAAGTKSDIWLLPLDGAGDARRLVGSAFSEFDPRLSPDGRWLAYASDETGIPQVYVQPFPALDARFLISASGGAEPVWSRDGRRLFYRVGDGTWGVSIAPGAAFQAGIPERLFGGRGYQNKGVTHTGYDVARDGRFLVIGNDAPQIEALTVVQSWFEELKRLVPTP